jgi:hypothetical protein
MPSFCIVSLLERQKHKYWGRIEKARQELARFEESLGTRLPEHVAAAVRQHIQLPWDRILKGEPLPEVPPEGQDAIAAIAPGDTAALEALLPDRWVVAHPEHRLEQREEESREAQARRRRKRAARRLVVAVP